MIHVNARAIIERTTPSSTEILVQVRNKPQEGGKWIELPGGRVEEFESLIDALRREVREETGLELTEIEGLSTRIEAGSAGTNIECLAPFAVYQTIKGPVDSLGVYFRCNRQSSAVKRWATLLLRTAIPIARRLPTNTHSFWARVIAV